MSLWVSKGFDRPGGIGAEEFEKLVELKGSTEGLIYRVISQPSFLPSATGVTYTQYTTCFSHNLEHYLANGWKDEGFESITEKDCIDWINTKPDCSLEVIFKNNPNLESRLRRGRVEEERPHRRYDSDRRRGTYL